jgi:hypothetical protein
VILGGVAQTVAGTYGSSSSGATFQNDEYFAGGGKITLALAGSGSSLHPGSVPEPSTIVLAGMLASLALLRRRQR